MGMADINIDNADARDIFIMHEEDAVLGFNLSDGRFDIIRKSYCPLG